MCCCSSNKRGQPALIPHTARSIMGSNGLLWRCLPNNAEDKRTHTHAYTGSRRIGHDQADPHSPLTGRLPASRTNELSRHEYRYINRNTFIHGRGGDVPPNAAKTKHELSNGQRAHSIAPLAHPVDCLAPPATVIFNRHTSETNRSSYPSFCTCHYLSNKRNSTTRSPTSTRPGARPVTIQLWQTSH